MPVSIDRDKLRVYVRQLDGGDLLVLLDRAIDLLPNTKLPAFIKDYVRPADLRSDGSSPAGLLEAAQRFHQESLAGKYYEDFSVNSKNCTDKSRGTQTWIAECHRLLSQCVSASAEGDLNETRTSFELIFNLLHEINTCRVNLIFFADEHGAWQVGVLWGEVMPAWFRCLAPSADAEEYAELAHGMISFYAHWESDRFLKAAVAAANADQAAALAALPPPSRTYAQPAFSR